MVSEISALHKIEYDVEILGGLKGGFHIHKETTLN